MFRIIQYSETIDEKMADITFPVFRARRRRAGGNARFFGQCGKRYVGDGVLQKESKRLRREKRQRGSTLLRGKLQQSRSVLAGRAR